MCYLYFFKSRKRKKKKQHLHPPTVIQQQDGLHVSLGRGKIALQPPVEGRRVLTWEFFAT